MPTEGLLTNEEQVEVHWDELTEHLDVRGSPVTSYNLQWDAGTFGLQWFNLVGYLSDSLDITYIVSSGIIPGHIYQFKVRAQN